MADLNEFQKLCIAFGNTFTTESGQKVLTELERIAEAPSYEPGMEDPDRAPYWHEGRRSVYLLCKFMMSQGSALMAAISSGEQDAVAKVSGAEVSILDESEED